MEVLIRDCPHCGQVLIDDTEVCPNCGQGASKPAPDGVLPVMPSAVQTNEQVCPSCGKGSPHNVLRCRDCGSYLNPAVAAAAKARGLASKISPVDTTPQSDDPQEMERPSTPPGTVAQLADDDDFEVDVPMDPDEDDFQFTPGSQDDYALSDEVAADEAPGYLAAGYEDQGDADYELTDGSTGYDAPTDGYETGGYETGGYETPQEGVTDYDAAGAEQPPTEEYAPEAAAEQPGEAVSHSAATGGDALLSSALQEETESAKRRAAGGRKKVKGGSGTPQGAFIVFCPNGCRVMVLEKHRGRTGRCPKCKSLFFVPPAPTAAAAGETATESTSASAAPAPTKYVWLQDVRLHRVNPGKLKLKADSLLNEYDTVDLGLTPEGVLLVTVFPGGGPFRAFQEPKKKVATREKVLEHLALKGSPEGLPAPKFSELDSGQLSMLKVVQPPIPGEESLFADVPVFGAGRIAVRIAPADTPTEKAYLSFTLSQFRTLVEKLQELFNLTGLGEAASGAGVPLTDEFSLHTCHYSENVLHALKDVTFHKADPSISLVLLGWKCGGCGLIVSEDSRKKEKIGGKADSSVPKARCPKCKKAMGDNRLTGIKS